jgi:hypothetical protein
MYLLFFRTIGLAFVAFFVVRSIQGLSNYFRNPYSRSWAVGISTALMGLLVFIGMGGFFAQFLVGTGALALPKHIQWPVGNATGVTRTQDGIYVVPLVPQSRVQLYDAQRQFLLGWNVDTGGKDFRVDCSPDGAIEVIRGNRKYLFSRNGDLLKEENIEAIGDGYNSVLSSSESVAVPTSPFLWIFTSPFHSWLIGALGIAGLALQKKIYDRSPSTT